MEDFTPFFVLYHDYWKYQITAGCSWISGKYRKCDSGYMVEPWTVAQGWDTPPFIVATEQEAKDALITAYVTMRLDGWTP